MLEIKANVTATNDICGQRRFKAPNMIYYVVDFEILEPLGYNITLLFYSNGCFKV